MENKLASLLVVVLEKTQTVYSNLTVVDRWLATLVKRGEVVYYDTALYENLGSIQFDLHIHKNTKFAFSNTMPTLQAHCKTTITKSTNPVNSKLEGNFLSPKVAS